MSHKLTEELVDDTAADIYGTPENNIILVIKQRKR